MTDDGGATASTTKVAQVSGNVAPTASFVSSTNDLGATFDASASSDSDGTVADYAWTFGDNTKGTGKTTSHTYGAAGSYTVTLTVTDNNGATAVRTGSVTVSAATPPATSTPPPPAPVETVVAWLKDAFDRTSSPAGASTSGTGWTLTGSASNANVANGVGSLNMRSAGSGPMVFSDDATSDDVDLTVRLGLDTIPVGGSNGVFQGVLVRRVAFAGDYRAMVRILPGGAVRVGLARTTALGIGTALGPDTVVPGLVATPGTLFNVRVQASGTSPTVIRAKVWADKASEPSQWMVSASDNTAALQTAGAIGFHSYLSGSTTNAPIAARFDDLAVATGKQ